MVQTSVEARTMESVSESHGPCESFELALVQIGLETTELRVDNETQIDTLRRRASLCSFFKTEPTRVASVF